MPDDVRRCGQFTTFKTNAAELLRRELHAHQRIYCSPLVDPISPPRPPGGTCPAFLRPCWTLRRAYLFCKREGR